MQLQQGNILLHCAAALGYVGIVKKLGAEVSATTNMCGGVPLSSSNPQPPMPIFLVSAPRLVMQSGLTPLDDMTMSGVSEVRRAAAIADAQDGRYPIFSLLVR